MDAIQNNQLFISTAAINVLKPLLAPNQTTVLLTCVEDYLRKITHIPSTPSGAFVQQIPLPVLVTICEFGSRLPADLKWLYQPADHAKRVDYASLDIQVLSVGPDGNVALETVNVATLYERAFFLYTTFQREMRSKFGEISKMAPQWPARSPGYIPLIMGKLAGISSVLRDALVLDEEIHQRETKRIRDTERMDAQAGAEGSPDSHSSNVTNLTEEVGNE